MKSEAVKEVLNTLFSHLEKLETQTEGLTLFLKEKKKVTDAQLAPYLEQAGKASNVRWRAARVRIEYLIDGAEREEEKKRKEESEREQKRESAAHGGQSEEAAKPGPWGQGVAPKESESKSREQDSQKQAVESGDSSEEGGDRRPANSQPELKAHKEEQRGPVAGPEKVNEQEKDDQNAA